ncbi:hypothetical protein [Priestia aryabhattai]|uniref:hypothetical protein n=1 Tax=Priestia aryabhattai TaxID=412384 RepID=UPI003D2C423A
MKIIVPNKTVPKFKDEGSGSLSIKPLHKKRNSYKMEKRKLLKVDCTFQSVMFSTWHKRTQKRVIFT